MTNPYLIREEAERIIGEDRVPTDVLEELVALYGQNDHAKTVRTVAENLARMFSVDVRLIEEDHNAPPGGTTDYEGRVLAFTFEVDGREMRVLVEDVTVDPEER